MDGAPRQGDREPGYRVLARKYRPTSFDDLIGQAPMVRTLSNAFHAGRIAQAWMLTGVRGVGKTTTARILARALNYQTDDVDRPTIDLSELGIHCHAIMEGRHVDVIEMDAASHTGIADIREIIDAARYKPVSARYKVYIIDEVHMLSNQAFNGLLKTLEEPPAHVKFVFATTEIRKVPVTVLSRCQRFDLRRIDAGELVAFLQRIADAESVKVEAAALSMIARAAEGSVRDSLSLLDQAIAHGAEAVSADTVRQMLGFADRARVIDLFEAAMAGDAVTALDLVKEQYDIGADPAVILADLASFTHLVTRFKLARDYAGGQAVTELERERGQKFAETLSIRALSRAWQILIKGVPEVQAAPLALPAADMVLVRLCYAADLPDPKEALQSLRREPVEAAPAGAEKIPAGSTAPALESTDAPRSIEADPRGLPERVEPSPPDAQVVPPAPARAVPEKPVAAPVEPKARAEPADVPPPADIPLEPPDPSGEPRSVSNLRDLADWLGLQRDLKLKFAVERQVRPIAMEPGRLEIAVEPGAPMDLAARMAGALEIMSGRRWMVAIGRGAAGETLHEIESKEQARLLDDAAAHPDVAAVLKAFPGARIVDVRLMTSDTQGPVAPEAPLEDDDTDEGTNLGEPGYSR
ncbi:MAG: DNA polymerase III subunit gamma/tau [Pseudomonadota bacterium]